MGSILFVLLYYYSPLSLYISGTIVRRIYTFVNKIRRNYINLEICTNWGDLICMIFLSDCGYVLFDSLSFCYCRQIVFALQFADNWHNLPPNRAGRLLLSVIISCYHSITSISPCLPKSRQSPFSASSISLCGLASCGICLRRTISPLHLIHFRVMLWPPIFFCLRKAQNKHFRALLFASSKTKTPLYMPLWTRQPCCICCRMRWLLLFRILF